MSISLIQSILKKERLDGWLIYDFHGINPIFHKFVRSGHGTRRVFYWIPAEGTPWKIVHKIEANLLQGEGEVHLYATQEELKALISRLKGRIAMEVSPDIPYISFVDGGTLSWFPFEVVSSGALIQELATLDAQAIESHLYAADVVDRVVRDAFSFVQEKLPYEKEVQDFILKRFAEEGCETDHGPIVAYGANSANPHYAMEGRGAKCKPDDFVLIDLWCQQPGGVFADITRVGSLGKPTEKMQKAFAAVREAQKEGVRNVRVGARGCDVDTAARRVLEKAGFGSYVMHRLGHSIDTELHGSGAHLDSFEACDTRVIIPNTCYSVEPAVYIPGEFGLRLEHDILVTDRVRVTGGEQNEIYQL